MFFVEIDDDGLTVDDIKRIANHLIDDHNDLLQQLSQKQLDDLSLITKPTLESDYSEVEIKKHWDEFIKDFVVKDVHGNSMRFYKGSDGCFYFGDERGMEMALNLSKNSPYPNKNYRSDD